MKPTLQARHSPHPTALSGSPWLLGLLAVLIFSLTIPMTRLANGSVQHPQLPALFVAAARSAGGGLLAAAYLMAVRARWPVKGEALAFAGVVLGGVCVFPMALGWAVRYVPASHAALMAALLPLGTACLAALVFRTPASRSFWLLAGLGATGMSLYVLWVFGAHQPGAQALWPYGGLVLAMVGAMVAYVSGAWLARRMPAANVMSWALVLAWPLTCPLAWWCWPTQPAQTQSWLALGYVATFSTWAGFIAWYAALSRDPLGASQLQLLQPVASMLLAAWLLNEAVAWHTWGMAGAAMVVVWRAQQASAKGSQGARA